MLVSYDAGRIHAARTGVASHDAASTAAARPAPGPDDDPTPNNYRAPDDCLSTVPLPVLTYGGADGGGSLTPTDVRVEWHVGAASTEVSIEFDFANPSAERTMAVVAQYPLLRGQRVVRERQTCTYGDGRHFTLEPTVHRREEARAAFEAAARSTTHAATLSESKGNEHTMRMDKVPAGASCCFRLVVATDATPWHSFTKRHPRDPDVEFVDVLTPVPRTESAFPVGFSWRVAAGDRAEGTSERPWNVVDVGDVEEEVLHEWEHQMTKRYHGAAVVYVTAEEDGAAVYKARGLHPRLLWTRLQRARTADPLATLQHDLLPHLESNASPLADAVVPAAVWPLPDGRVLRVLRVSAPTLSADDTPLSSIPDELLIVLAVDVSGSTTYERRLESFKDFMKYLVALLPSHVQGLRDHGFLSSTTRIRYRVVSFSDTLVYAKDFAEDALPSVMESVREWTPCSFTDFGTWMDDCEAELGKATADTRAVAVVATDGGHNGRTDLKQKLAQLAKVRDIEYCMLGYGAWLDPRVVRTFETQVGAEALKVHSLDSSRDTAMAMLERLSRCIVRVCQRMTLTLPGVLAVRSVDNAPLPTVSVRDPMHPSVSALVCRAETACDVLAVGTPSAWDEVADHLGVPRWTAPKAVEDKAQIARRIVQVGDRVLGGDAMFAVPLRDGERKLLLEAIAVDANVLAPEVTSLFAATTLDVAVDPVPDQHHPTPEGLFATLRARRERETCGPSSFDAASPPARRGGLSTRMSRGHSDDDDAMPVYRSLTSALNVDDATDAEAAHSVVADLWTWLTVSAHARMGPADTHSDETLARLSQSAPVPPPPSSSPCDRDDAMPSTPKKARLDDVVRATLGRAGGMFAHEAKETTARAEWALRAQRERQLLARLGAGREATTDRVLLVAEAPPASAGAARRFRELASALVRRARRGAAMDEDAWECV